MICPKCGKESPEDSVNCVNCGEPLTGQAETAAPSAAEETEVLIEKAAEEADVIEEGKIIAEEDEPEEEASEPEEEEEPEEEAEEEDPEEDEEPGFDEENEAKEIERIKELINFYDTKKEEAAKKVSDLEEKRKSRKSAIPRLKRPLTVWGYMWRIILFGIPIINIIPLFVFAFSGNVNKNSKNLASAILVLILIMLIIFAIIGFMVFAFTDRTVLHDFILKYFKISI